MDQKQVIRTALLRARAGTEELLSPLPEDELVARLSPHRPPLVSELAHIAYFEELWLLRNLEGRRPVSEKHEGVYQALRHAPDARSEPPLLRPAAARAYAADVRKQVLGALERADLQSGSALVRKGFVFGFVLQHELQRQERMLETIQLRTGAEYSLPEGPAPEAAPAGPDEIEVPGGAFPLGAVEEPWAYDNELVPHEVELRPFSIDRAPVSNATFAEFIEDDGYRNEKLWSPEGWRWNAEREVAGPLYWERGAGGWERVRFGRREPVPLREPVQHVSFHEADAFARWAGKRLPTEAEWERAASWDERTGKNRFPWGREWMGYEANLGHQRLGPAPVGSFPGGESASGCLQMAGDVWEWTSSFFQPYPGFVAFPDGECSETFFGERHHVLRGGSWATDPIVARTSFRSWSSPERRELFAGFRCARDA